MDYYNICIYIYTQTHISILVLKRQDILIQKLLFHC